MKKIASKKVKAPTQAANEPPKNESTQEAAPTTVSLPIREEFDVFMESIEGKKGVHKMSKESISPYATDIHRVRRLESKFYRQSVHKNHAAFVEWEKGGEVGDAPKRAKEMQKAEIFRTAINIGLDVLEMCVQQAIAFPKEPEEVKPRKS